MAIRIVKAHGILNNEIKRIRIVYYTTFDIEKVREALKYHLYLFYVYDYKLATPTTAGWYRLREYEDKERAQARYEEVMRIENALKRKQKRDNEKSKAASRNTE